MQTIESPTISESTEILLHTEFESLLSRNEGVTGMEFVTEGDITSMRLYCNRQSTGKEPTRVFSRTLERDIEVERVLWSP